MEAHDAAHRRTAGLRRRLLGAVRLSDSSRVEAFSDGVLAITITLLVVELRRPDAAPGTLFDHLWRQWASYLAFLASFVYVGVIWLNHHSAFTRIRELASSPDLVLPGHDPLVLERLKRVGDGIVEM